MKIAIVGVDDEEYFVKMRDWLADEYVDYAEDGEEGTHPTPPERIYVVDSGRFAEEVRLEWELLLPETPFTIMRQNADFGIASKVKRDQAIANEVDVVMAFWDFKEPNVMGVITQARIWGKKVIVNPNEPGSIISPAVARAPHTQGICGYDDEGDCEL